MSAGSWTARTWTLPSTSSVQQGHSLADTKPDQRYPQIGADGQAAAVMLEIGPVIKRPGLRPSSLDRKAHP